MPTAAQRLIYAVRTGNYERLGELLRLDGAVAEQSKAYRTALHAAAEEGDLRAARMLVEAGADVNARMDDGKTPLHCAAGYGKPIDLLDRDLDRRDCCARSRDRSVSKEVAKVIVDLMKEKDPRIPEDLEVGEVPKENDIYLAALFFSDYAALLKEIAARGVDIDRVDPAFAEFLRGEPRYLRVAEFLLDHGAEVNSGSIFGETPLSTAVEYGAAEMVELLLNRGAVLKFARKDKDGNEGEEESLLWKGLDSRNTALAEVLWKHGAKLPGAGELNYLAASGYMKKMLWLIDRGVDVNARDDEGNTPILSAGEHVYNVAALLERGANYHAKNNAGDTLLHACAASPECLKIVLPLGLDVNARNEKGRTPLHIAAQSSDECALRMLLKAGASPDIQDREGNTPLHLIFESEEYRPDVEFPAFHALVAGGANRSISNAAGKTAADVAAHVRYPEEYLQLLDPVAAKPATEFIWLGEPPFSDFLPKAMIPVELDGVIWPSVKQYAEKHNSVMRGPLLARFQQHQELRAKLLGTGDATLVSDWTCGDWTFNTVGRMLMEIRAELRRSDG